MFGNDVFMKTELFLLIDYYFSYSRLVVWEQFPLIIVFTKFCKIYVYLMDIGNHQRRRCRTRDTTVP